ncbi:MAG: hypothetical protein E7300_09220 [Lachnospiraceae bacterium]|nr:hypothetical protein [Lachnospiraceae bacterium]
MTRKEWMNEGIDLRLEALLLKKKCIWLIVGLVGGAILAAGLYFLTHVVYAPAREYEAVSKLYLTFATDENGDVYQYYNGYTWNDLMQTEPIMDPILQAASAFDASEVEKSVKADILSDIRVLTLTVRSHDPALTDTVIRAAEESVVAFGDSMQEFTGIKVIDHGKASLVIAENETFRAAAAGGVIGLIAVCLILAFLRTIDAAVYVPTDFEKLFGIPVLDVTFTGDHGADAYASLIGRKEEPVVPGEGSIIRIPYGTGNVKKMDRIIKDAALAGNAIQGAVIENADYSLYKAYFAGRKTE